MSKQSLTAQNPEAEKEWNEQKPVVTELVNVLLKNNLSYEEAFAILRQTQVTVGKLKLAAY